MAIKTSGLDHVHVYVEDLTGFVALFQRLFECDATLQSEIESIGSFNSSLRFREGASSPFLDVFAPSAAGGAAEQMIQRRGECVAILSFRVEDLEAAAAHAAACGLREVSRIGFPGVMRQVQFHPADTRGFQLELVEYEPGAEERIAEIQRRKAAGEPVEGLRTRPAAS